MKILYTTDSFALPDHPGAARCYQVAKWLKSQGHEVTVICNTRNNWNGQATFTGTPEKPELYGGIKIVGAPTPSGRHKSRLKRVLVYLSLLVHTYLCGRRLPSQDIIIASTPPLLQPLAALYLARRCGAVPIMEVRDLHPQMAVAAAIVTNPLIIRLWGLFERALRFRFDHIVAAVPSIRSMATEEGVDPARITVITNGYDLENDEDLPLSETLATYFEKSKGKYVIGYIGNMGLAWNILGLLQAAQHLRHREDITFLFIGNGAQYERCVEYARDKGLASCTFLPVIGRLEAAAVMRRCYALVLAYPDKSAGGLPRKLFDYMGAGRPVVFSGKGDGPELLLRANGGIVMTSFDSRAFAKAIVDLVTNPLRAAELGQNNRRYVENNLLRHSEFRKWNDVIGSLSPAGKRGSGGTAVAGYCAKSNDEPKA